MGAAFGNRCYGDNASAHDAYFSGAAPVFLPSGNVVSFQQITGVWNRVESSASGVISTVAAPLPSLGICDPLAGFTDGATIGAGLGLVLITGVLIGLVSKAK